MHKQVRYWRLKDSLRKSIWAMKRGRRMLISTRITLTITKVKIANSLAARTSTYQQRRTTFHTKTTSNSCQPQRLKNPFPKSLVTSWAPHTARGTQAHLYQVLTPIFSNLSSHHTQKTRSQRWIGPTQPIRASRVFMSQTRKSSVWLEKSQKAMLIKIRKMQISEIYNIKWAKLRFMKEWTSMST